MSESPSVGATATRWRASPRRSEVQTWSGVADAAWTAMSAKSLAPGRRAWSPWPSGVQPTGMTVARPVAGSSRNSSGTDPWARARPGTSSTSSGAEALTREYFGGYFDRQPSGLQETIGDRATFIDSQVTRQLAAVEPPWFVDLLRSDAGIGWDMATMPVLGVFGGKDVQVVAEQNAPLMEAQLADSHPASRVVTLPAANHLFQAAGTGSVAEYGSLAPVFTPDLLPLVTGWVAGRVDLSASGAP